MAAKLFFGMNQSLDGYVDHMRMRPPSPKLFRHFIEQTDQLAGSLYGRHLYELMHYWDVDQPGWDAAAHAFAAAWRKSPKWVVSRTLKSLGPNARLLLQENEAPSPPRQNDEPQHHPDSTGSAAALAQELERAVRRLKDEMDGEIEIGGPNLARTLTELGLIDEYRIYLHPEVLGHGTPFFAAARPPLRLAGCEQIDDNVIRLSYVPV